MTSVSRAHELVETREVADGECLEGALVVAGGENVKDARELLGVGWRGRGHDV